MTNSWSENASYTINDLIEEMWYGRGGLRSTSPGLRIHGPYHDENSVYAEVEVPGIDPKGISVEVEGKAVHIKTPKGSAYFTIGERLNSEDAVATLKHGMLTVRVPTKEARKVEVRVEVAD